MDIPIYFAFLAGTVSFISPCVLPLVPPYLCYMAGVSIPELSKPGNGYGLLYDSTRYRVLGNAVLFVLGFSVIFVSLGASASVIGRFLLAWSDTLATIAGIVIIMMGLHFLNIFRFGLLQREARFQAGGAGPVGSFVMGLAFAFGWTPCIGPILAPILALAGSRETIGEGAFLLAVYSAGLGIPFILSALFIVPFMHFLNGFRKHLGRVKKAMGLLLVLTGMAFLTGGMQIFGFWLLEAFPGLSKMGTLYSDPSRIMHIAQMHGTAGPFSYL